MSKKRKPEWAKKKLKELAAKIGELPATALAWGESPPDYCSGEDMLKNLEWVSRDLLIIKVLSGPNAGVWRHARYGGWAKYEGSAFSHGGWSPSSLQSELDKFSNKIIDE